jgi:uncharacterized protein (DUF1697 family)
MARRTAATRHVAFLRGINVGGHRVKMAQLVELLRALGLANVGSFIASGNLIFDAPATETGALEVAIQRQLQAALGYEVDTFIRSAADLADIVAFDGVEAAPGQTLHVGFLRHPLDADDIRALKAFETPIDSLTVRGRDFHWLCHGKSSESLVPWPRVARDPRFRSTLRNITMLRKLVASIAG